MRIPNFRESYRKAVEQLKREHHEEKAMSLAVGGEFEAVGKLERAFLIQHGLQPHHTVIDVGCGSGRLAFQLRDYLEGTYIGMDVVKDLFEYAQRICNRPDWRFYEAPGLEIPEPDESADFVCFFSVFTHLLHHESYRYLAEAKRVLKPGGKIIFSFLEFRIPEHWSIFENYLNDPNPDKILVQFLSRDAIEAWAEHLGLEIIAIHDSDTPYIRFEGVIRAESGAEAKNCASLGQSACVMTKR